MGFLSNLFYKQNPSPAPKFNRKRLYLTEATSNWDRDFIDTKFFEKFVKEGVRVFPSSKTINLNGVIIDGSKLPRKANKQDEKAARLRIDLDGWKIQNAVYDDIPGGCYVVSQFTEFEKSYFVEIGEDAISTPVSATQSTHLCGIRIIDCNFYNRSEKDGGDKSIQLNNAHQAVIRGCFFTGGVTSIRVQDSRDKQISYCSIHGNVFSDVPTAVNADGVLTLTMHSNVMRNVRKNLVKGSKVRVKDKL